MTIIIPGLLPSAANLREHWAAKHRRVKQQRQRVTLGLVSKASSIRGCKRPMKVTFIRVAPRLLDQDNMVSACKALADSIAKFIGVDDRDKRWDWRYGQAKGKPACVIIEIEELPCKR